jgi:cytochrome c553
MKRAAFQTFLGLGLLAAGEGVARGGPEPLWAYGYLTPPAATDKPRSQTPPPTSRALRAKEPAEEQTRMRTVDGSSESFSKVDMRDGGNVADWFPGDHPPMTKVMKRGPASLGATSWGCAFCHLPTGKGRPENAPVAGQTAAYLLRQLEDFRDDARTSADPRKANTPIMAGLAKAMTPDEMREAADYFAAAKWSPWTRVVETDLVPRTKIEGNLFRAVEKERTEPIAGRIIEVPEDPDQSEGLRNPRSGFVAYVPVGSVKRGEILVTTGGSLGADGRIVPGRTFACAACHGANLMGLADMPGIAGRSPSYLVRQLYDMQQGTRKGKMASLMQPVVAHLTADDMVAIAAFVASRTPPGDPPHG